MGQHLGFNIKSNVPRRRLEKPGGAPEACEFRLVVHGQILAEAESVEEHRGARDAVAALYALFASLQHRAFRGEL